MIEAFRHTKEWHNNAISDALTNWIDRECILFMPRYLGRPFLYKYFMPRVVPTSVENRRTSDDPSLYGLFGRHPWKFLRRKPWKTDNLSSISIRIAPSLFWKKKVYRIFYISLWIQKKKSYSRSICMLKYFTVGIDIFKIQRNVYRSP